MLYIHDTYYEIPDLAYVAREKVQTSLSEQESYLWNFINQWFNEKPHIEVYTSGSTGKPKKIRIQKKNMLLHASLTCRFFNLKKGMKALLCLPANKIGGIMMIVRAIQSGMDLFYQTPTSNPLENVHQIFDFAAMVPYQARTILDETPDKWKYIKQVIIGGGTISTSLEKDILDHSIPAYSTFGMTETISHIALKKIDGRNHYTTLPGITIDIDKRGCLIIEQAQLYEKPIVTNDLVNIPGKNTFEWLGRIDHMIESGGIKIIPEIIEEKIRHLIPVPFFVGALPDRELNQRVVLITEGTIAIDLQKLQSVLEKYECPKEIYSVDSFSYTETGKISRKETIDKIIYDRGN